MTLGIRTYNLVSLVCLIETCFSSSYGKASYSPMGITISPARYPTISVSIISVLNQESLGFLSIRLSSPILAVLGFCTWFALAAINPGCQIVSCGISDTYSHAVLLITNTPTSIPSRGASYSAYVRFSTPIRISLTKLPAVSSLLCGNFNAR